VALEASVAVVLDVPVDPATGAPARFVRFGRGENENFFARAFPAGADATITLPEATDVTGAAPEKNPCGFALYGNFAKVAVVAPEAITLTASFYK
jgi:hypothetical protein